MKIASPLPKNPKGAGRKPTGKVAVQAVVTFKDGSQREKFKLLGGSKWVREMLEKATS